MTVLLLTWYLVVNGTVLTAFPSPQSCEVAKAQVQYNNPYVLVACVPYDLTGRQ